MDLNYEILLNEFVTISFCTKGGFTWEEILNLDYRLYEQLLKEIEPIKKSYEKDNGGTE